MTRPTTVYVYRGRVERLPAPGCPGLWKDGYSSNGPGGGILYPWMTYRECQAEAKAQGCKAVFVRQGCSGTTGEG